MSVRPRGRSEGILVERLEDGLVIFDTETDQAHSLNATAAAVLTAADGTRTVPEIAEAAGLEETAALAALQQLGGRGLLDGPMPVSRRSMLRRTALVGAVIAAVPVIETVVIPTAVAHASTPTSGLE
jgi:Coenzyme PQQ synthesis protein D (PqqD)